jgi:hypothetical protein
MAAPHRPPLTDSPWFWVLTFSVMALGALAAINGKYGSRQTVIERQYQARDRIGVLGEVANNSLEQAQHDRPTTRRDFASPDENLIPLWPLAALLVAIAAFAGFMLYRGRGRPGSRPAPSSP